MFPSIRWRILIPYAVIIVLSTLGLTFYVTEQVRQARYDDLQVRLLAEAGLIAETVAPLLDDPQALASGQLDTLARQRAAARNERITFILLNGMVAGESHENRALMDNHLYREEVQRALSAGGGTAIRYSRTVNYEMMYAAVPAYADGELKGIVRVALSLDQITANTNRLSRTILSAGMVTTALAVLLGLVIAERTARPVRQLTHVVERVAKGDLNARLLPAGRDEVAQLTTAFNHMTDQLREQMEHLGEERSRLAAILTTMADGVIITDQHGLVQLCNPAAVRILHITGNPGGRTFAQVVFNHQLIALWERSQQTGAEQSDTVETDPKRTFLHAIVTPLPELAPPHYLIVIQDLTHVRRLETIRRDFISNISHELRTPLAALKAVVETLRDGALHDPPTAQRFLTHIESELNNLTQVVQELLELSRIESGKAPVNQRPTLLEDLITLPVERLRPQAERAGLRLEVTLPAEQLLILADAERVHQILINLLHNAIKFTPTGGTLTVAAHIVGNEVTIAVQDTGVGIAAEDLPRIFERFYKGDRARASEGTGLGLAIAKHLVQAHGGRIWAESRQGVGSKFTFTLPVC